MLRQTLNVKDEINIRDFLNLKALIKTNSKGYKPKKSLVLRWDQIMTFLNEAPDVVYLAMKIILIFGVCGCLRCDEITNLKVEDVENLGDKYLVSINFNKNEYAGQFIIGRLFYSKVSKYISLRPSGQFSDKFFLRYQEGKCHRQVIGRHKIGQVPEKIASYLQLPNAKKFTGHCFRRTSATLLSDSGANMQMVKQLGRWRSDIIAQGYIENSMHNRQLIFNGIVQNATTTNSRSEPSTTAQINVEKDVSDYNLNWSDFSDDFVLDEPIPRGLVNSASTTASKTQILVPVINRDQSNIASSKSFPEKTGIKLNFENQTTVQPRVNRKRDSNEDLDNQSRNAISTEKRLKPSTNTQIITKHGNDKSNDLEPIPSGGVESGFTTASKKPLLLPANNQNKEVIGNSKLFLAKPGIKLHFKNGATVQQPKCSERYENM